MLPYSFSSISSVSLPMLLVFIDNGLVECFESKEGGWLVEIAFEYVVVEACNPRVEASIL